MAVTSGLSIATDARDSAVLQRPRSSWALSWPLALGLVLFVWLPNSKACPAGRSRQPLAHHGRQLDPDARRGADGRQLLLHLRRPALDRQGMAVAGRCWRWPTTSAAGARVAVLCAAAIGFTFALLLRLLLRDIRPLPALLFTVAAAVMTAPHLPGAPARARLPVHADLGGGPGARRRGTPRARAAAAAGDAGVGQPAWRLHLGLVLCGAFALEALVGARDAAERKMLFVDWAKFGVAAVLVACITPYGPESILVTLRIFGLGDALRHDQRMAVARLPDSSRCRR